MSRRTLTDIEAVRALADAGFRGYRIPTMFAIGAAESGLDAHAVGVNDHDPSSPSYRSLDLGWLQINTFWWIDGTTIRVQDMLDPLKCARRALDVFVQTGGSNVAPVPGYSAWNTYDLGRHLPFLPRGAAAWKAIGQP